MSGDVITTFPADVLEDLRVDTLVEDMEQDQCMGVPGARYDETTRVFLERYVLIIGERILQGHEDVLTCINDPTSAGKRLMLYKKPESPRTVATVERLWPYASKSVPVDPGRGGTPG